jgi:hypothetical protein
MVRQFGRRRGRRRFGAAHQVDKRIVTQIKQRLATLGTLGKVSFDESRLDLVEFPQVKGFQGNDHRMG